MTVTENTSEHNAGSARPLDRNLSTARCEIAPYRAVVPPVADDVPRPRWSVMIPTFNCAGFLRETLRSVLAQDPGADHMQIEVVDDASSDDDPEAVVRELGAGRVAFYRQPRNVGHVRNFETCLTRSRGELVHLLHGDDLVRDGFYRQMDGLFAWSPELRAAFSRHLLVDERGHWTVVSWLEQPHDGVLDNWLARITVEQRIQTPAMVVRRDVYERLGGFDRRLLACGEDWEMWIRIAADGPVGYLTEPLAAYRVRSSSLSGRATRTAQDTRDLRLVTEIVAKHVSHHVSDDEAKRLLLQARKTVALAATRQAGRLIATGDRAAALAQVRAALACSQAPGVVLAAALTLGRALPGRSRGRVSASDGSRAASHRQEQRATGVAP